MSIIGGADGPTAVFMSSGFSISLIAVIVIVVVLILVLLSIFRR